MSTRMNDRKNVRMSARITSRAEMLALKRAMLLEECALQRHQLALEMRPLVLGAESLQVSMRIVGKARRHPEWIALAALGLAMVKPRQLSSVMRLGAAGMRMWRQVRPLLQLPGAASEK